MNGAHLHLLLNHFPIVGGVFGIALLAFALLRRRSELTKVAMVTFVAVAGLGVLAYLTGEPAEDVIKGVGGLSESAMEQHEEAAFIAMIGAVAVGVYALIGLVALRKTPSPAGWFTRSLFVLAVGALGAMGWAANLGGQIRHPEIQGASSTAKDVDHERRGEDH